MKKLVLILTIVSLATAQEVKRPKILGLAHVALFVADLQKARAFYKDFLGYEEPYALKRQDGADRIAFIKINENQFLELFAESPKRDGQLNHISFYTDDAKGMRDYLASKGVKVPPVVARGQIKNANFNIVDPDGHTVEIVQYEPDSWTRREAGKFVPASRISTHIAHVGVLIGNLDASMKFYGEILGFQETWRGGAGKTLSWVNMRVPDGDDYLEFMLYGKYPEGAQVGVKNHICLVTPDIEKAVKTLEARPGYKQEIAIKTGVNRKRQANLFDPGGTRVELMEAQTVDGKPTPPSTAPPPVSEKKVSELEKVP